jgi:broad specificity phosphatase PhoE
VSARITLLAAASTSATAGAAFPADEPLDLRGRAGAAELAGTFARPGRVLCSPARVARETAAALSLDPVETAPLLADLDAGRWAGRTLDVLGAPADRFWRIDVAPLTATVLRGAPGRWTLRSTGAPPRGRGALSRGPSAVG